MVYGEFGPTKSFAFADDMYLLAHPSGVPARVWACRDARLGGWAGWQGAWNAGGVASQEGRAGKRAARNLCCQVLSWQTRITVYLILLELSHDSHNNP
jgi:hypothetical protein